MTIPIVRQRVKHKKTRTGCRTCRQRRIKCDEGGFPCKNCIKSERVCSGYDSPAAQPTTPATHAHSAVLLPKQSNDRNSTSSLALLLCREPKGVPLELSSLESKAFDFFRLHTIYDLPGSTRTVSWERLVHRASQQEVAVTHAVIALAAMHRAHVLPGIGSAGLTSDSLITVGTATDTMADYVDREQYRFALTQYTKAVSHLRAYIDRLSESSEASIEVVLILSLLFFCFDVFHGDDDSAIAHLTTGIRILHQQFATCLSPTYEADACKGLIKMQIIPSNTLELLVQTFVRFDHDMLTGTDDETYILPICDAPLPKCFDSLEEALTHLDVLAGESNAVLNCLFCIANKHLEKTHDGYNELEEDARSCLVTPTMKTVTLDAHPEVSDRLEQIRGDLAAWMAAHALYRPTPEEEAQHILANVTFFFWWTEISHCRSESETYFDGMTSQFEYIISLIERFLAISEESNVHLGTHRVKGYGTTGKQKPGVTTGTNIIGALYTIATKFRNTAMRRRCLDIMRTCNMQGVYDQFWFATFVQFQTDWEESTARQITGNYSDVELLPKDYPPAARIYECEAFDDLLDGAGPRDNYYKMDYGRLCWTYYSFDEETGERNLKMDFSRFTVDRPKLRGNAEGLEQVSATGGDDLVALPTTPMWQVHMPFWWSDGSDMDSAMLGPTSTISSGTMSSRFRRT